MRTLFVSSEVFPLAKTGGLADVSEALPAALSRLDVDIRLMLPAYPCALERLTDRRVAAEFGSVAGVADVRLIGGRLPQSGLPLWLVDAPALYDRDGGLYQDHDGRDWPDNAERFALLSHVAALVAGGDAGLDWQPDTVHANDWHTGLLPLLVASRPGPRPATIFTIHNMAFQGVFPGDTVHRLPLPDAVDPGSIEYYGQISFLKAGIAHSDRLTTVSPTYARQILSPEYGCGLDGVLRDREKDLTGILNGAAYGVWDPCCDEHLPATFRPDSISGKAVCKAKLQEEMGLAAAPDVPLLAFVSRLTDQKMADVVLDLLPWLLERGAQLVLHGRGERWLEEAFRRMAACHPGKIAVRIGYDEATAHRVLGGADILLAPSRFEPCGLTQLYAMRYGTVPVVRRTGGLADTVADATGRSIKAGTATGFVFDEPTAGDIIICVTRALALYQQPLSWRRIRRNAMKQDFGWMRSAEQYLSLYRDLVGDRSATAQAGDLTFAEGKVVA